MTQDHDEDAAVYYASLQRRARALDRVLNLPIGRAPTAVVAFHLKLLLMAGIGYCGAALRDWWLGWLDEKIRQDFGLCQFCGRRLIREDDAMCAVCAAECEMDDMTIGGDGN